MRKRVRLADKTVFHQLCSTLTRRLILLPTRDRHARKTATQVQVLHAHGEVHLGDIP